MSNNFSLNKAPSENVKTDVIVAMSVYKKDRLNWVKEAVSSIVSQEYSDFIFVITVDGPVSELLKDYLLALEVETDNVYIATGEKNVGLSACMNFIIDWAKRFDPKYFFRMDADDISSSERLSKQVAFLEANENVAVLGSALEEINEDGKVVGKRMLPLSHEEIVRFLPKRCSVNHPTVAIRYTVFNKGFRYQESYRNIEDYFLWAELAANGFVFTNLRDTLLKFRRANDFYVRRGFDKSLTEFKARLFTMKVLKKRSLSNYCYAVAVMILRLMPKAIIQLAYKVDRFFLEKMVKH